MFTSKKPFSKIIFLKIAHSKIIAISVLKLNFIAILNLLVLVNEESPLVVWLKEKYQGVIILAKIKDSKILDRSRLVNVLLERELDRVVDKNFQLVLLYPM